MAAAIQTGEYGVLAELAALADSLQQLSNSGKIARSAVHASDVRSEAPQQPSPAIAKAKAPKKVEYPLFEVDGDRLVKVGWSKKDRTTYEHRVPREIAHAFSLYLADQIGKPTFRMDELLPAVIGEAELPLYQAYLVLAWLRDQGLVSKDGKDGYSWVAKEFDDNSFEAAWDTTTRRVYS
jgi:hypothetical protein